MPERAGSTGTRRNGAGRGVVVLVLLCTAQFVVVLDTTIVNVALPAVGAELGFTGEASLQYVLSLYALTFGSLLVFAGRLADLGGRRRLFTIGLLVFTAASLGCGFAASPAVLLAARSLQGAGAAFVSATALALLTTVFADGQARRRALGAWSAIGGAAGATGLILGGVLTDTVGWRWTFLINVPVGLCAALAAPRVLPGARRLSAPPDIPGALTGTAGLAAVIFGLTRGEQVGFTAASTVLLFAAGAALLAGFVLVESRAPSPLLPARLLRSDGVAVANLAMLALSGVVASALFFTTLYTQQVLGFSPLGTGIAFLPNSILVLAGSALASRLLDRVSARGVLAAGLAVVGAGSLLLAVTVSVEGSYLTTVLPGFALNGLGLGLSFVAATSAATSAVSGHHQGSASGLINTAQQVGFAVGLAALVPWPPRTPPPRPPPARKPWSRAMRPVTSPVRSSPSSRRRSCSPAAPVADEHPHRGMDSSTTPTPDVRRRTTSWSTLGRSNLPSSPPVPARAGSARRSPIGSSDRPSSAVTSPSMRSTSPRPRSPRCSRPTRSRPGNTPRRRCGHSPPGSVPPTPS